MTSFDDSAFKKQIASLKLINREIASPILKAFKDLTPKNTGNARNKTKAIVTNDKIIINADYSYATELDSGASPKAPQGMTKPVEKEVNKIVNTFINKIGKM